MPSAYLASAIRKNARITIPHAPETTSCSLAVLPRNLAWTPPTPSAVPVGPTSPATAPSTRPTVPLRRNMRDTDSLHAQRHVVRCLEGVGEKTKSIQDAVSILHAQLAIHIPDVLRAMASGHDAGLKLAWQNADDAENVFEALAEGTEWEEYTVRVYGDVLARAGGHQRVGVSEEEIRFFVWGKRNEARERAFDEVRDWDRGVGGRRDGGQNGGAGEGVEEEDEDGVEEVVEEGLDEGSQEDLEDTLGEGSGEGPKENFEEGSKEDPGEVLEETPNENPGENPDDTPENQRERFDSVMECPGICKGKMSVDISDRDLETKEAPPKKGLKMFFKKKWEELKRRRKREPWGGEMEDGKRGRFLRRCFGR